MPLPSDLYFFRASEFRHPDLVNEEAAHFLDEVRAAYQNPMVVTDDARTLAEQAARENAVQGGATGAVLPQLHVLGRAFDIRWPATSALLFRLVEAICHMAEDARYEGRVELELDATTGNQHIHFGLRPDRTWDSTLLIRKAA